MDRESSQLCPGQSINTLEPIVCCDVLPEISCVQTVDALLNPGQSEFLFRSTTNILNSTNTSTKVGNSFRTALELTGTPSESLDTTFLDAHTFKSILQETYEEIEKIEDMQVGDILVFENIEIVHAAVYLGSGLIVQKENTFSAVSSISTINRALEYYRSAVSFSFYSRRGPKAELHLRVYRKVYRSSF
jgi:hypothetical protein